MTRTLASYVWLYQKKLVHVDTHLTERCGEKAERVRSWCKARCNAVPIVALLITPLAAEIRRVAWIVDAETWRTRLGTSRAGEQERSSSNDVK